MKGTTLRRAQALFAIGTLMVAGLVGVGSIAQAPAATAAPANANTCAGTTDDTVTNSTGPIKDLTALVGRRATDYDAGKVVVLYDVWGSNTVEALPPLCGTRNVGGASVSEWMFCTDIHKHSCGGTDASGSLINKDGQQIAAPEPLTTKSKLSATQEKLIAYLIQHEVPYTGSGTYDFGATIARSNGNSAERYSLQTLVWCISDVPGEKPDESELASRAATCDASLPATEQARLLSLIPDDADITLNFGEGGKTYTAGTQAQFTLSTNIFGQPIDVAAAGSAGSLVVVSGDATLAGGVLTVSGTEPLVSKTVTLGFTAATAASVTVSASAHPAAVEHISWNQSSGVALDGIGCQLYATFPAVAIPAVADSSTASFLAATLPTEPTEPTTDPGTTNPTTNPGTTNPGTTEPAATFTTTTTTTPVTAQLTTVPLGLAHTGSEATPFVAAGILTLLLGGALLLVGRRRRAYQPAHRENPEGR